MLEREAHLSRVTTTSSLRSELDVVEPLDLEILAEFVPRYYRPSRNPIAMVVGD